MIECIYRRLTCRFSHIAYPELHEEGIRKISSFLVISNSSLTRISALVFSILRDTAADEARETGVCFQFHSPLLCYHVGSSIALVSVYLKGRSALSVPSTLLGYVSLVPFRLREYARHPLASTEPHTTWHTAVVSLMSKMALLAHTIS